MNEWMTVRDKAVRSALIDRRSESLRRRACVVFGAGASMRIGRGETIVVV